MTALATRLAVLERAASAAEHQAQFEREQAAIVTQEEIWTPTVGAAPHTSLHDFVRGAWKILEPAEPFVDGWHISLLCDHLQALSTNQLAERDLLINQPPGSSKSLITSVFWQAWEWTWAPWTRWLVTSYAAAVALNDALRTRRLMQSEWYRRQCQDAWKFVGDQNVMSKFVNDRTGWRASDSVNGQITSRHVHRLVCDDPHNVKDAESDAVRQSTISTLREVFPSRVMPGSGCTVIIGQRVHEEDASADWLAREQATIHHIELQEEFELPTSATKPCSLTGRSHDIRTIEGELLRPDRYGPALIQKRKLTMGPYAWSGQFQQRPSPRAGQVLDPAWFKQTPTLEWPKLDRVVGLDLNYSSKDESDWTVGIVLAVDRSEWPQLHVVDVLRKHLAPEDHERVIGDWLVQWRPLIVGIERRAFDQGGTMDLCRRLERYLSERGVATSIEPTPADADKVSRAQIIAGRASAGYMTANHQAPWFHDFSVELSKFPKSGTSDQVDALGYACRLAIEKLAHVRGMQQLLGHSSGLAYVDDTVSRAQSDYEQVAWSGLR